MKVGDLAHVRTGDKGDCCNIGVIAYNKEAYDLLKAKLTAKVVADFYSERVRGTVTRYEVDSIMGLNFLMTHANSGGVSRSLALDKHGTGLGMALLELEI